MQILVRARLALRVAVPEQPEDDAADGIRRAAAVLEQVREGRDGAGLAGGVTAKRGEQIAERLDRQPVRREGVTERDEDRVVDRARVARAGEQLLLVCREAVEPAGGLALVSQVVAATREGVHRRQVAAQMTRQEKRPDREVLVVGAGEPGALGVRLLDACGSGHHVDGSTCAR